MAYLSMIVNKLRIHWMRWLFALSPACDNLNDIVLIR
jgi:hypothetical protein